MSNDTSIAMLRAPYLERRVEELTYVQLQLSIFNPTLILTTLISLIKVI